MALIKNFPSGIGPDVTYHNIAEVRWSKSDQTISITLNSFLTKQNRLDGFRPVQQDWVVALDQTECPELSEAYSLVKADERWDGASDA